MKVEFVRGIKHMPNLAKHTFTSAIKSHTHKSLMEQTMSFWLFRWKKQSPHGWQDLAQSMDARGNWGQNQHLTDSGVQNLSTKPYRAKTPQESSCHMDCIPERSSQSPAGSTKSFWLIFVLPAPVPPL